MCTCLKLKTKDYYFGRNLDLEYRFDEKVVITPRNYAFDLKNNEKLYTKHAIIGMATVFDKYPLYAEAANEKGLCMAGLYFPENAVYKEEKNGCINLAPFELIPWFLGNFESISEIRKILDNINITNIKFNDKFPNTQLHWMISDKNESIVLEQMEDGLKIYDNPYEVMTNNPPFNYHLVNINNYMNVSAKMPENQFAKGLKLKGYGQGMGMIGLPGDVTPTSRFVRVVFNKFNSCPCNSEEESISQFFHILDSVSMIKGTVITESDNLDMTTYSSCINASKGIYYFKTYYNNQINAISMNEENKIKNELSVFELPERQNINYLN